MDYFNNFLMSTNKYLCGKESEIKIDKDYFEKIYERIEKILNNEETDIKKI